MKVVCISAGGVVGLTNGKVYEVIHEGDGYYRLRNDLGNERKLYTSRFKSLDCNICIDRRCNSCPIDKEKL